MLKILENKQEALELVSGLANQSFVKDFYVGVTGSFMEGTSKKSSSVDIVLKLKNGGNKNLIGSISVLRSIMSYLNLYYHHKFNILWYDLLVSDDKDLITYISEEGLEANPESVYGNVVESLQWSGDDNEETDIEEDEVEETDAEGDEIDG